MFFRSSILFAAAFSFICSIYVDGLRVTNVSYGFDTFQTDDYQMKVAKLTLNFDSDVFAYFPNLAVRLFIVYFSL